MAKLKQKGPPPSRLPYEISGRHYPECLAEQREARAELLRFLQKYPGACTSCTCTGGQWETGDYGGRFGFDDCEDCLAKGCCPRCGFRLKHKVERHRVYPEEDRTPDGRGFYLHAGQSYQTRRTKLTPAEARTDIPCWNCGWKFDDHHQELLPYDGDCMSTCAHQIRIDEFEATFSQDEWRAVTHNFVLFYLLHPDRVQHGRFWSAWQSSRPWNGSWGRWEHGTPDRPASIVPWLWRWFDREAVA